MSASAQPKQDGRVARRTGTREAIMDAATELFAARGVTSTSIDDIAAAAGIAKGSIYYNFESKAGLVEDLRAAGAEGVVADVQAAAIVGATLMAGLEWLVFHPERSYGQVIAAVLGTLAR